uniref:Uncharacterized protein n=1 Tax=Conchiformibius kuhniae TaxID=211502 RepID=A0A8T9MSK0_9NEIS|nr:hypothetical protein LVJ77_06070 [Conchiformibius kuhniae]
MSSFAGDNRTTPCPTFEKIRLPLSLPARALPRAPPCHTAVFFRATRFRTTP